MLYFVRRWYTSHAPYDNLLRKKCNREEAIKGHEANWIDNSILDALE